ncbi:MAG: 1-(5-phosphoribosyl)-5-[(5-phosphoribosylamino)methylideneamino] imidazole-4-carboxamide isomerase [Pseudomonadota bacterium]
MQIIPTIELSQGRCVSLIRGKMDDPEIWHVDPVEKAREFASAGATWMHITDLDAVAGTGSNADLIEDVIQRGGLSVQVAGGIYLMEHARRWADAGAGRMVVGTAAVRWPDYVKEIIAAFPDQIVLAVDVWQGKVMAEGWTETTAFEPWDFMKEFDDQPLAAFLVTDIDRDLDEPGSSIALTSALAGKTRIPVIASGLVKTLDDVSALKYVYNIWGAIVGRVLMSRDIELAEAVALVRPTPEPIAAFK